MNFKTPIGISNLSYQQTIDEIIVELSQDRIFVKRKVKRSPRIKEMVAQAIENGIPNFFISENYEET